MLNVILSILYILTVSFTITIIFCNLCEIKINRKHSSIFIGIIFVVSYYLAYIFKRNDLLAPILTIITCVYFTIILKKIYYPILVAIITQIIFALSDAIAGATLIFIFKFSYSQITNNKILYFFVALIILLIAFFISKLVKIFFKKLKNINFMGMSVKSISISILILSIVFILIYSFLIIYKYISQDYNIKTITLNLLLILTFVILLITIICLNDKNVKKNLEKIYKENELLQLKEYTNMLESNSNNLRKFKHDYLNILQIIGNFIESENMEDLKGFYKNELMPESNKILATNMCFTLLQHIKINSLKGLISSKIISAQSKNIDTRIEISEDINKISVGLIDICRIIGILFDNAIEEAVLCDNGFIEFVIIQNKTCITFFINNSCTANTPPIFKIYDKNFSTKGPGRGIGLKSVRDIIDLNYTNMSLNTLIDASIFKQELTINN
jgi:two-component system, LytTR family, sensor histidine kinase AgrC